MGRFELFWCKNRSDYRLGVSPTMCNISSLHSLGHNFSHWTQPSCTLNTEYYFIFTVTKCLGLEQSSGKKQFNGYCEKLCQLKHIQLFPISELRFIFQVRFLEYAFLKLTQIMFNHLTLTLNRQVHFPKWVFWVGIFTAFSWINVPYRLLYDIPKNFPCIDL